MKRRDWYIVAVSGFRFIVAVIGYFLFPWPETYHWWHTVARLVGFILIMQAGAGVDRIERPKP